MVSPAEGLTEAQEEVTTIIRDRKVVKSMKRLLVKKEVSTRLQTLKAENKAVEATKAVAAEAGTEATTIDIRIKVARAVLIPSTETIMPQREVRTLRVVVSVS